MFSKSVEGLVEMKSESFYGRGRVTLKFQVGTDPDTALLKVSNNLNQVPEYPDEAEEPVLVSSGSEQNAIAWIILERLSGDNTGIETEYQFIKDFVKPRFERIPGVAESEIYGGVEPEMQVTFDPNALAAHHITIAEVAAALSRENENISAGDFDEGKRKFIARTVGQYQSPNDVETSSSNTSMVPPSMSMILPKFGSATPNPRPQLTKRTALPSLSTLSARQEPTSSR